MGWKERVARLRAAVDRGQINPPTRRIACYPPPMLVEKLKYLIWAQDMERAVRFYREVFDAEVVRQSEVMAELTIAGSTLGIASLLAGP